MEAAGTLGGYGMEAAGTLGGYGMDAADTVAGYGMSAVEQTARAASAPQAIRQAALSGLNTSASAVAPAVSQVGEGIITTAPATATMPHVWAEGPNYANASVLHAGPDATFFNFDTPPHLPPSAPPLTNPFGEAAETALAPEGFGNPFGSNPWGEGSGNPFDGGTNPFGEAVETAAETSTALVPYEPTALTEASTALVPYEPTTVPDVRINLHPSQVRLTPDGRIVPSSNVPGAGTFFGKVKQAVQGGLDDLYAMPRVRKVKVAGKVTSLAFTALDFGLNVNDTTERHKQAERFQNTEAGDTTIGRDMVFNATQAADTSQWTAWPIAAAVGFGVSAVVGTALVPFTGGASESLPVAVGSALFSGTVGAAASYGTKMGVENLTEWTVGNVRHAVEGDVADLYSDEEKLAFADALCRDMEEGTMARYSKEQREQLEKLKEVVNHEMPELFNRTHTDTIVTSIAHDPVDHDRPPVISPEDRMTHANEIKAALAEGKALGMRLPSWEDFHHQRGKALRYWPDPQIRLRDAINDHKAEVRRAAILHAGPAPPPGPINEPAEPYVPLGLPAPPPINEPAMPYFPLGLPAPPPKPPTEPLKPVFKPYYKQYATEYMGGEINPEVYNAVKAYVLAH